MNQWTEDESGFNYTQYGYEYNDDDTESSFSQFELEGDSVSESQDSASKSIFKNLSNKFYQSEQVDVHPDLANLVNNSLSNGLSNDNHDKIVKQILWSKDCDSLVKTCSNQGIWRLLKIFTQSVDLRLAAIQCVLFKAPTNLVKLVEKL